MNKESLEHLSSLMDGEMSRETGLFMTRRLSSDNELCAAWNRYHLIRECIRQPGGGAAVLDLCERVHAALGEETVRQEAPSQHRWLRSVAGLAIAASVAMVAIIAVGPQGVQSPDAAPANTASIPFTSPNTLNATPASQPASFSPRLNSYLLRHNQLARTAGHQGFVSFVPMMSAQAQADTEEAATEPAADPAVEQPVVENTEQ